MHLPNENVKPFLYASWGKPLYCYHTPSINNSNYHSSFRLMPVIMQSNSKCGFFNGTLIRPLDSDPLFNVWDRCNTMIMTSMINSIEIKIVQMCDVDGYYTRLPITITLSKIMERIEQFSPHPHMLLFYTVFFMTWLKKIRITMRETMLLGSSKVSINIMCISIQKYPHEPSHSHEQGFLHAHSTKKEIHNLLKKIKFVANLASWGKKTFNNMSQNL